MLATATELPPDGIADANVCNIELAVIFGVSVS